MNADWKDCKNILCIRPDNMGDVLMSSPAFRALKSTFGSKISLLTSSAGAAVAKYIPGIDEVIIYDLPWVKVADPDSGASLLPLIELIKSKNFDAAVIFTVYSQNPLPSAMIAYLAGIPQRLAYCRENPYGLLNHWVPDQEPYHLVRHQVIRDLDLVATIGAFAAGNNIQVEPDRDKWQEAAAKLEHAGADMTRPWLVIHPGVSEKKREYPLHMWISAGRKLKEGPNYQLIITGTGSERAMVEELCAGIGKGAFSAAGILNLEELMLLLERSPLLISVNTGTVHLASAVKCRVLVLYALTNPQHLPWQTIGKVLTFPVPDNLQSQNEVIREVCQWMPKITMVEPGEVYQAAKNILQEGFDDLLPELIPLDRDK